MIATIGLQSTRPSTTANTAISNLGESAEVMCYLNSNESDNANEGSEYHSSVLESSTRN